VSVYGQRIVVEDGNGDRHDVGRIEQMKKIVLFVGDFVKFSPATGNVFFKYMGDREPPPSNVTREGLIRAGIIRPRGDVP
jgi:hypothetical protein